MYYSNSSIRASSGPKVNKISSMQFAAPAFFNAYYVAINAYLPCFILPFQRESP